jgi:UDP-N-acetylmuramoyl-tripeptide--D-alanyl-D-alanine ligase
LISEFHMAALAGELGGKIENGDTVFNSVSIDTRTLTVGDLFIALRGTNFDGNKFVAEAKNKGACGAIVSCVSTEDFPQLLVVDTTVALGKLANLNRRKAKAKVIGITGSQGKTTVKEMIGKILAGVAKTLVTKGNMNNRIGVPLTLLALAKDHRFAVIEMGASGLGEIAYTGALVEPQISVLTNASATHIEGFGSLRGVVETKGEIIDAAAIDGSVVLNADDVNFEYWKQRAGKKRVVSFSDRNPTADYFASAIRITPEGASEFEVSTPTGKAAVLLPLPGNHNIANALAAAAAAIEAGASLTQVVTGLSQVRPVKGRMCVMRGYKNSRLIDDSYNASPSSFRAAIDVLAEYEGTRILVVGDMAEMGDETEQAHRDVGAYAAQKGIDNLWALGNSSVLTVRAFGAGGEHFKELESLFEKCKLKMTDSVTVLVKGSRSARMDRVVDELLIKEAK